MKTLEHFKDFVNEITESNSRLHKQAVLKKYKDDDVIRKYLKINFDPYRVYGISTKKLSKVVHVGDTWCAPTVFDLFDYLEKNNTGRDVDVAVCQLALSWLSMDTECAVLLERLICKEITLGIDAKTINKEIPGCVPTFDCMLANKYFDKPEKLSGKSFAITTKLDGFRLIAMKDEHDNVSFYSRVGKRIEGLVEIEEEFRTAFPPCTVLDGELTVSNYFELESKEAYKAASKIISQKGETPKTGLTYRVFDAMHIDEWRAQNCTHTYGLRRELLHGLFKFPMAPISHIELLPVLYKGDDTSKVQELLDKVVSEGGEGVMINLLDSTYKFTRCWDIMKVKKFQSLDLEVIDLEEGSGRLAGTLGAILVRYKGGNVVRVGSGFSDEERTLYWSQPDLILHKIVEIKYFESTRNTDGQESLRFPTWVSNIRDPRDKATPDY
jgi:DNA ligase-1